MHTHEQLVTDGWYCFHGGPALETICWYIPRLVMICILSLHRYLWSA